MLRDYVFTHDNIAPVVKTLSRFKLDVPEKEGLVAILKFEVITPDSFMWRVLVGHKIYYIYAEDYIPSLEHVKRVLNAYIGNDEWSFVPPKEVKDFESASPVVGADVYNEPEDVEDVMKYSVDSGHDFVFLARSKDDADNAYFSDYAANGFKQT